MMQTLSKLRIEGISQPYKGSLQECYMASIIRRNDEELNGFDLRFETRQRCLLLPLLFSVVLDILGNAVRQGQEIKAHSLFCFVLFFLGLHL